MTNHFLLASDWLEKRDKQTKHIVILVIFNIIVDEFMFYINVREYRCIRFQFISQINTGMSSVFPRQLLSFSPKLENCWTWSSNRTQGQLTLSDNSSISPYQWHVTMPCQCFLIHMSPFLPGTTCNKQHGSISHSNSSSGFSNGKQEISRPHV